MRKSKAALDDLEVVTTAWKQISQDLDGAIREMGDVENLLQVLQADAELVAQAVCNMPSRSR